MDFHAQIAGGEHGGFFIVRSGGVKIRSFIDLEFRLARQTAPMMDDVHADHILDGRGELQGQQRQVDTITAPG
jgi:hypothetical protein